MENTTYWRGKVRVFELHYGDGSKDYQAEFKNFSAQYKTKFWDTTATVDGLNFDTADDAVAAAKAAWERQHADSVTYKRKIWP